MYDTQLKAIKGRLLARVMSEALLSTLHGHCTVTALGTRYKETSESAGQISLLTAQQ